MVKNLLFTLVLFTSFPLISIAQPGIQGDLFININTKKYQVKSYHFSQSDTLTNNSQLIALPTYIHQRSNQIVVVTFVTEMPHFKTAKNILLTVSHDNKNTIIAITGVLNPLHNYVLDINQLQYDHYNIAINEAQLKVHKNRMGFDLTPFLQQANSALKIIND
jgi:hypothetical protein